jgi:hypothetical protein
MKIIVAGYMVAYPLVGMSWGHLNILLGLKKLGHDVWFLEDSGEYLMPFDPSRQVTDADSSYGRRYVEELLARFGLAGRWCYYSQFENKFYGMTESQLDKLCRSADLFINVSTVNPVRPMYAQVRRKVALDTDPVYTQIRLARGDEHMRSLYAPHDVCFTCGMFIGEPKCDIPTGGIAWRKMPLPTYLDFWRVAPPPPADAAFTTVMNWSSYRSVEFNGRTYGQKDVEFDKLWDLPKRAPSPIELAIGRGAPEEKLRAHGWRLTSSVAKTQTLDAYHDYITGSRGELGITKNGYIAGRTGSFSDRSQLYLASGRPVLAQETGFSDWLPTGEGLLVFNDIESAVEGIERINRDYVRHAAAARRIAEEYFDSDKVLSAMLEACG